MFSVFVGIGFNLIEWEKGILSWLLWVLGALVVAAVQPSFNLIEWEKGILRRTPNIRWPVWTVSFNLIEWEKGILSLSMNQEGKICVTSFQSHRVRKGDFKWSAPPSSLLPSGIPVGFNLIEWEKGILSLENERDRETWSRFNLIEWEKGILSGWGSLTSWVEKAVSISSSEKRGF